MKRNPEMNLRDRELYLFIDSSYDFVTVAKLFMLTCALSISAVILIVVARGIAS